MCCCSMGGDRRIQKNENGMKEKGMADNNYILIKRKQKKRLSSAYEWK